MKDDDCFVGLTFFAQGNMAYFWRDIPILPVAQRAGDFMGIDPRLDFVERGRPCTFSFARNS